MPSDRAVEGQAKHWGWRVAWAGGRRHAACRATGRGQRHAQDWGWSAAWAGGWGHGVLSGLARTRTGAVLGLACGVGEEPGAHGVPSGNFSSQNPGYVFSSRAREARCFLCSRSSCAGFSLSDRLPWGPATATARAGRVKAELQHQGHAVVPPDSQAPVLHGRQGTPYLGPWVRQIEGPGWIQRTVLAAAVTENTCLKKTHAACPLPGVRCAHWVMCPSFDLLAYRLLREKYM